MLLTSEPGRIFAVGLEGKHLEPEHGEPAFYFKYLSGRDLRACRDLDETIPLVGMTTAQADSLYSKLRELIVNWEHVVIGGKPVLFKAEDVDAILTDGEAKRLLARMIAANELHPDELKKFASPSAGSTESSATANAEKTAKNPPTQR